MNMIEFATTGFFRERDSAGSNSSKDTPVINERQEGKSGNTQGDKKENPPAIKATTKFTGVSKEFSFWYSYAARSASPQEMNARLGV